MTKEEFDKARLVYENEKRKLEEASLRLDKDFADISKEYLKNLITLDVGEFYVIDLTFTHNQRIYFKWTDSCKVEYRKEINEIKLCIDEIISIHNGDISIQTNCNYLSSLDRIGKNLGKVNLSVIKDAVAYIKRKLEPYEMSCLKEIKENAELKNRDCWKSCEYANPKAELIEQHIKDVQNLTKAIEFLKWALHSDPEHDDLVDFDIKWKEAEQFIKEIEK